MLRKFTLFCILLTLTVMLQGAYLRLQAAGLGCPEWPGCPERLIVDAVPAAPSADAVQTEPGTDITSLVHRYLSGGLGVSVLVLAVAAFRAQRRRVCSIALAWLALFFIGSQLALHLQDLLPRSSAYLALAHYLASLTALCSLYGLALIQHPSCTARSADAPKSSLRWLGGFGLAVMLAEIVLGAWTGFHSAALACPDFPTCLGSFDPPVDWLSAFGLTEDARDRFAQGLLLPHSARAAIHWAHRLLAIGAFVPLSLLALSVTSNRRFPRLSKPGVLLSFLLLVEIALGIAAVILRLPIVIGVAHATVAMLLLLNVLHIAYFLRHPEPLELPQAKPAAEILDAATAPTVIATEFAPPAVPEVPVAVTVPGESLFERLRLGLGKTRTGLTGLLANLALGKKAIDRDLLDEIETQLLIADVGVTATREIIDDLTQSLERSQLGDAEVLTTRLREHLLALIEPVSQPLEIPSEQKPFVILVVGVNGVGKTTTIGKLAKRIQNQGRSVMLAAGDTFRAAAVEQLQTWGERNQIAVIAQQTGADSASVIFDAVQAAQARGIDVLIADTAGRLHTKSNLMEELSKIKRIMGKLDPTAPHEVLLVLDAGTGQNALSQAKQFNEAVGLTGLVLTKLDGTAKGGVVFALARQFGIPIRYIGVGETIDDLQDFDAKAFVDALFS